MSQKSDNPDKVYSINGSFTFKGRDATAVYEVGEKFLRWCKEQEPVVEIMNNRVDYCNPRFD